MTFDILKYISKDDTKINVIANISGKIFSSALSILIVPFYIKILGIESYGLIGIFTSLTAIMSILDFGLSTTLNRELAKLTKDENQIIYSRNLIRTLEVIYLAIGILISLIFLSLSPYTQKWVNPINLSAETINNSFILMSFIFLSQWPSSFYWGGLTGLRKQLLQNLLQFFYVILKTFGSLFFLWLISPRIEVFFIYQIIINTLYSISIRYFLWKNMPKANVRPMFRFNVVKQIKAFASGISVLLLLSLILTQLDKIILSRILSLEMFGYYSLATIVASNIGIFVNGIYNALFPKFSQLIFHNEETELKIIYHKACQLVSLSLFPISLVIVFFSKEVIYLWNGDLFIAMKIQFILILLTIGQVFNNLVVIPLALQIASGWLKLSIYKNIIAVALFIPLMFYFTKEYDLIGAGICWILLNLGYFIIEIPIMHSKLLKGELKKFYLYDVFVPFIIGFSTVYLMFHFKPIIYSKFEMVLYIIATGALSSLLIVMFIPNLRKYFYPKFILFTMK